MSVASAVKTAASAVFTAKKSERGAAIAAEQSFNAGSTPIVNAVVAIIDSDPTKSGIVSAFENNSIPIVTNPSEANSANRLRASYTVQDADISGAHHTQLSKIDTAGKEIMVARLVSQHYSDNGQPEFEVISIRYSHEDGSNKSLTLSMILKEQA